MHRLLGWLALVGLGLETCLLRGPLQWFDVYAATASRALRDGPLARAVMDSTQASPYVGAALVVAGVLLALRARVDVRQIGAILLQLAAGLLLAWVFKMLFARARPGDLPWELAGDSFPSGHVAHAILCVGTTFRLVRRGDDHGGRLAGLIVLACGLAFVPLVAYSRVVLARHWVTDVVGSMLLGTALLALAPTPGPAATRRLLLLMPVLVFAAAATSAVGSRIQLPSPSTLSGAGASGWQANDDYLAGMEIDDPWAMERPSTRFTLLSPTYGKQMVDVNDGRSTILKVLARRHFDLTKLASQRLELLVDGAVVGAQPLGSGWRMLAFALPALTPGQHEFELRPLDRRR